jgi:hypothetical protein
VKPEPITVTDVDGGPEVGERTILGITVNDAAGEGFPALDVTMTWKEPGAMAVDPTPTVNAPDKTPAAVMAQVAPVKTRCGSYGPLGEAEIVHVPASVVGVQPLPETVTRVPALEPTPSLTGGDPLVGKSVIVPAVACAVGVTRDETEINTPEVRSNNTKNEEPTLMVVN